MKPRVGASGPRFFRCEVCGRQYVELAPCGDRDDGADCCGGTMKRWETIPAEGLPQGTRLDYKIVGGYNDNAIQVFWESIEPSYALKWVYLKTFTGGQIKFMTEKKRLPMVFSLADEDAYCYCDEDPCLECIFCCKRGFTIYAMIEGLGLVELPLSRMSAYWQSK